MEVFERYQSTEEVPVPDEKSGCITTPFVRQSK